jgi:type VI secretion system protein ImpA
MIAIEELLQPITEGNPSGAYLRYDPVYDAIKEARREEENLNQGAWQRELKAADFPRVISLSTSVLQKRTKDLQIAAWLTEALLRQDGFAGLAVGLKLIHGIVDKFWDSVYPPVEEDDYGKPDLDWRVSPLDWVGFSLETPVRNYPLNHAGHSWHQYTQSRTLGYEDQVEKLDFWGKLDRKRRLADGPLTPEAFDQSFAETPLAFYVELERQLDASLTSLAALSGLCDEKLGPDSPWFGRLQRALEAVAQVVQELLARKRTECL